MKPNSISETGVIGTDGKLRLPMDRLNQFFADNKGKRIFIRFESQEPGSSAALLAYYYNYVVPTVRQAMKELGERMDEKRTDAWILKNYPGDKSESNIGVGTDVEEGRHLTQWQMIDMLEWLKQFAAENLNVYIEDPKTI